MTKAEHIALTDNLMDMISKALEETENAEKAMDLILIRERFNTEIMELQTKVYDQMERECALNGTIQQND